MKIKAVLFDMDGVLVDAKEWHFKALNDALIAKGFSPIGREEHLSTYDGLPTRDKLAKHPQTRDLTQNEWDDINSLKQKFTLENMEKECFPVPEHKRTLEKLKAEGFRFGCCSNSVRKSVEMMLKKAEIIDYMEVLFSNQDVKNGKPNPEIYQKAIEKLGLKPQEILICEDNIRGITSAMHSGAYVLEIGTIDDVNYENIKNTIDKIESEDMPPQITRLPIRTARISEMIKGWFVGDFYPSILQTKNFEAGIKCYKKGDKESKHFHKIATEITVIVKGKVIMCDRIIKEGEMILMKPEIATSFEALEDTTTFVIKTASVIGDKYLLEETIANNNEM